MEVSHWFDRNTANAKIVISQKTDGDWYCEPEFTDSRRIPPRVKLNIELRYKDGSIFEITAISIDEPLYRQYPRLMLETNRVL